MTTLRITHSAARFCSDDKGAVAIILGLAIIPLMLGAGIATDVAIAQSAKARLDSSADAAALAAINAAQAKYIELAPFNANPQNAAKAAGEAQGVKSFMAQAGKRADVLVQPPTVSVIVNGSAISASVSYAASVPSHFGKLAKVNAYALNNSSGATLSMGKYLDFYLMVDVSGSMGIPTAQADQLALAAVNPDSRSVYTGGCVFACHSADAAGNQQNAGFTLARQNKLELRVDSVAMAVSTTMDFLKSHSTTPQQFRAGIYPFIDHAKAFSPLTNNLDLIKAQAGYNAATHSSTLGDLLDMGDYNIATADPMGSGGTHLGGPGYPGVFDDMSALIPTVGTGLSQTSPQPFVFFISDGMEDSQSYLGGGWWPGVSPNMDPFPNPPSPSVSIRPIDPKACEVLKTRGITVGVIYVPYQPIAGVIPGSPAWDYAQGEDRKANTAVPYLSDAMKACASSPQMFVTANSAQDINTGLQYLTIQAMQSARLTQ
jgi:Flp pilus assembly protein TadG